MGLFSRLFGKRSPEARTEPAALRSGDVARLLRPYWAAVSYDAKRRAVQELGRCNDPDLLDAFVVVLRDPESGIRSAAVECLIQIGSPAALEQVIGAIQDKHVFVRRSAILGIGTLRDPRLLSYLLPILECSDVSDRDCAISAVAQLAGSDAPRHLQKMLADRDAMLRKNAKKHLEKLGWRVEESELSVAERLMMDIDSLEGLEYFCHQIETMSAGPERDSRMAEARTRCQRIAQHLGIASLPPDDQATILNQVAYLALASGSPIEEVLELLNRASAALPPEARDDNASTWDSNAMRYLTKLLARDFSAAANLQNSDVWQRYQDGHLHGLRWFIGHSGELQRQLVDLMNDSSVDVTDPVFRDLRDALRLALSKELRATLRRGF